MAATVQIAFVNNTNVLTLTGLLAEDENAYMDSATVTVTVTDNQGNPVGGGAGWPLTMEYIAASQGNYRVALPAELLFINNKNYIAVIDADGSDSTFERKGHWEMPFKAQTRTS